MAMTSTASSPVALAFLIISLLSCGGPPAPDTSAGSQDSVQPGSDPGVLAQEITLTQSELEAIRIETVEASP